MGWPSTAGSFLSEAERLHLYALRGFAGEELAWANRRPEDEVTRRPPPQGGRRGEPDDPQDLKLAPEGRRPAQRATEIKDSTARSPLTPYRSPSVSGPRSRSSRRSASGAQNSGCGRNSGSSPRACAARISVAHGRHHPLVSSRRSSESKHERRFARAFRACGPRAGCSYASPRTARQSSDVLTFSGIRRFPSVEGMPSYLIETSPGVGPRRRAGRAREPGTLGCRKADAGRHRCPLRRRHPRTRGRDLLLLVRRPDARRSRAGRAARRPRPVRVVEAITAREE